MPEKDADHAAQHIEQSASDGEPALSAQELAAQEAARLAALPPAAQRALQEAAERREKAAKQAQQNAKEIDGPKGEEPTRFGDWERGGRAIDF